MSKRVVRGGDIAGLLVQVAEIKKARRRTGKDFQITVIQEAELDGFWIHRVLEKEGIEGHFVDPASIMTSRQRRRAKTDRIDGEALVRALMAYRRGEPRVSAMLQVPPPEEEDRRQGSRELKTLTAERVRMVNRIKGLLFAQGVKAMRRCAGIGVPSWNGCRPVMAVLYRRIWSGRSSARSTASSCSSEQIKAVKAERDVMLAAAQKAAIQNPATMLI